MSEHTIARVGVWSMRLFSAGLVLLCTWLAMLFYRNPSSILAITMLVLLAMAACGVWTQRTLNHLYPRRDNSGLDIDDAVLGSDDARLRLRRFDP